jgi:ABC-type antimicrobial peptide transport system permease subunit
VIGVDGVISRGTAERVREFGLRIALGAQSGDISRLVLRQGFVAAAVGVLLGLLSAALLRRFMSNMLFAVEPLDLATFATVGGTMLATAAFACWLPARRATRVDPLISLRAG